MSDKTDREQDLRATEDSIRVDVDRLSELERAKEGLDPQDPDVDRMSSQAVDLADRIAQQTRAERQLSEELDDGPGGIPSEQG